MINKFSILEYKAYHSLKYLRRKLSRITSSYVRCEGYVFMKQDIDFLLKLVTNEERRLLTKVLDRKETICRKCDRIINLLKELGIEENSYG